MPNFYRHSDGLSGLHNSSTLMPLEGHIAGGIVDKGRAIAKGMLPMKTRLTPFIVNVCSCLMIIALPGDCQALPADMPTAESAESEEGAESAETAKTELASRVHSPSHQTVPLQTVSAQQDRIRPIPNGASLRPVSAEKDHIYGDADAATSLITYMDFACPYCRKLQPVLLRAVNEAPGDINWVFRHFPLAEEADAPMLEALASECVAELAGELSFWKYARHLLTMSRRVTQEPAILAERAALKQGLEWQQISTCINRDRHRNKILEHRKEAVGLGVAATPSTVLMRGDQLVLLEGLVTTEQLKAAIGRLGN